MAIGRAAPTIHRSSSMPDAGLPGGLYPSSTTWAFVPDHPNPLTPASRGRIAWAGHGVAVVVTRNGNRAQSIAGLGLRK